MTTVVIVDDHPIVRAGLRAILDTVADIRVVAEGENGADALRLVNEHDPDVLALDVACTGGFRAVNVTVREPCLAVSARSCSLAEC